MPHTDHEIDRDIIDPVYSCPRCGEQEDDCGCYHCSYCCEPCDSLCRHCDNCASCCTCESNSIADYGTRVERHLPWIPAKGSVPLSYLYLGVELETEKKYNRDEATGDIAANLSNVQQYRNWAMCKHDGSLDDGFEVVTAPSSLAEHAKRWPYILRELRKDTASWRRESTGLHVHLSRRFFTGLDLAKFIYFINAEENRKEIVMLAGRTSPTYSRLKKKNLGTGLFSDDRRYEAVNLQPSNTIEVRMFKGTLSTLHVLADIEFCHALAHYVKTCSLQDLSWSKFWVYVESHKGDYKHLISYMMQSKSKFEAWITELDLSSSFFEYTEAGHSCFARVLDSEAASSQLPIEENTQQHLPNMKRSA